MSYGGIGEAIKNDGSENISTGGKTSEVKKEVSDLYSRVGNFFGLGLRQVSSRSGSCFTLLEASLEKWSKSISSFIWGSSGAGAERLTELRGRLTKAEFTYLPDSDPVLTKSENTGSNGTNKENPQAQTRGEFLLPKPLEKSRR